MRVLSLFDKTEEREVCISFVSKNSQNINLVNGRTSSIYAFSPAKETKEVDNALYITFAECAEIKEGYFLSLESEDTILKIISSENEILELAVERSGFIAVSEKVEVLRPIRFGILTVSDKGSRGERIDTAGPGLAEEAIGLGSEIIIRRIIPDDEDKIKSTLIEWSDKMNLNVILITGGTGLSKRDITPESIRAIADKEVPGFGEKMRIQTSGITERAILSRSLAVTRGQTLMIALPGSLKGAVECFQVVAPVIRHAVEIICGWSGECGSAH